jgi:hypothetical protein
MPTIPMEVVHAVSSGAIGVDAGRRLRGHWLDRKDARLGRGGGLHFPVEEGVELRQFDLERGQWGIDLWLPLGEALLERKCCWLECSNTLLLMALPHLEIYEAHVDDDVMCGEALTDLLVHLVMHLLDQLLDEQLDVGVHVFDLLPAAAMKE